MGVVEESMRLYLPFVDEHTYDLICSLDPPDQAYFWTMLYYEMPRRMGRSLLNEMERDVINGTARMRVAIRRKVFVLFASFSDAEDAIKPHSWFKPIADEMTEPLLPNIGKGVTE